MKVLHTIPKENFTKGYQQEYDRFLKIITITRQTMKHNLRHVYRR